MLAICSMIIDWAYKGDLFHYGIVNTPVELLKSKRIGMRHDEFIDLYQYNGTSWHMQLSYNSSSPIRKKYPLKTKDHGEELEKAFKEEFGYTFSDLVQVIETMVFTNDDDIISIPKSDVIPKLISNNNRLTEELIQKVLADVVYEERQDFLELPKQD